MPRRPDRANRQNDVPEGTLLSIGSVSARRGQREGTASRKARGAGGASTAVRVASRKRARIPMLSGNVPETPRSFCRVADAPSSEGTMEVRWPGRGGDDGRGSETTNRCAAGRGGARGELPGAAGREGPQGAPAPRARADAAAFRTVRPQRDLETAQPRGAVALAHAGACRAPSGLALLRGVGRGCVWPSGDVGAAHARVGDGGAGLA